MDGNWSYRIVYLYDQERHVRYDNIMLRNDNIFPIQ